MRDESSVNSHAGADEVPVIYVLSHTACTDLTKILQHSMNIRLSEHKYEHKAGPKFSTPAEHTWQRPVELSLRRT